MKKELICINCPVGCQLTAEIADGKVISIEGNSCPRGKEYAEKECIRPERILTSTVRVKGGIHRVLPVISDQDIPLDRIMDAMEVIRKTVVQAPVAMNDVIIPHILDSDVNIIASRSMDAVLEA